MMYFTIRNSRNGENYYLSIVEKFGYTISPKDIANYLECDLNEMYIEWESFEYEYSSNIDLYTILDFDDLDDFESAYNELCKLDKTLESLDEIQLELIENAMWDYGYDFNDIVRIIEKGDYICYGAQSMDEVAKLYLEMYDDIYIEELPGFIADCIDLKKLGDYLDKNSTFIGLNDYIVEIIE